MSAPIPAGARAGVHVRIIEVLEKGPATGDAVAAASGTRRGTVSTYLSYLRRIGILTAEPVECDRPGRPTLLYRLAATGK